MRPDLSADLFEKEETYWWHVARREMVIALLAGRGLPGVPGGGLALDVGCGGGYTSKVLESSRWRVVSMDVSDEALSSCRRRGLKRLCRTDLQGFPLPFKTGSFDLVLAMDVIEHVEDDRHALAECRRILKEDGLLVVTVPAYMALWSAWDEALGHRRRYTGRRLSEAAVRAGLAVERMTYFFCVVLPAAVVVRSVKRLVYRKAAQYTTDFVPIPRVVNGLLILVGRLERFFVAKLRVGLPFGLSVIAVLSKR